MSQTKLNRIFYDGKPSSRLKNVLTLTGLSAPELARKLGYKSHTALYHILNDKNDISDRLAKGIIEHFPEFEYKYLRTGEGSPVAKITHSPHLYEEGMHDIESSTNEQLIEKISSLEKRVEDMDNTMKIILRLIKDKRDNIT